MTSLRVPEFGEVDPFHRRLHQITQAGLSPDTAQTAGMRAAGRNSSCPTRMSKQGQRLVPATKSGCGAAPGDFILVPPWVSHREENPDPDIEAIVVIARSTQEAIVVDREGLEWAGPVLTNASDVDVSAALAANRAGGRYRE